MQQHAYNHYFPQKIVWDAKSRENTDFWMQNSKRFSKSVLSHTYTIFKDCFRKFCFDSHVLPLVTKPNL